MPHGCLHPTPPSQHAHLAGEALGADHIGKADVLQCVPRPFFVDDQHVAHRHGINEFVRCLGQIGFVGIGRSIRFVPCRRNGPRQSRGRGFDHVRVTRPAFGHIQCHELFSPGADACCAPVCIPGREGGEVHPGITAPEGRNVNPVVHHQHTVKRATGPAVCRRAGGRRAGDVGQGCPIVRIHRRRACMHPKPRRCGLVGGDVVRGDCRGVGELNMTPDPLHCSIAEHHITPTRPCVRREVLRDGVGGEPD
jgi:hypothetical protein